MDYYKDVRALNLKLEKLLKPYNLLHEFDATKYPITCTIKQNQTPDAQMAIYDTAAGSVSSCDATIRFVYELDDLDIRTDERLVIPYKLFTKIRNLANKLHAAYTAAYFAERRDAERLALYGDPDAPAKDSDEPCEE